MIKVAPSILAANFNNLLDEVKSVESADYLHIDVMDGHFVPNISLGACVYKGLKNQVDLVFDVHLMIKDPKKYALDFIKAGADILTFHYEALDTKQEIHELIDFIHNNNVDGLEKYLDKIAKYSSNELLLPVGADHLGMLKNANEKIKVINSKLKNYEIIEEIKDYYEKVKKTTGVRVGAQN